MIIVDTNVFSALMGTGRGRLDPWLDTIARSDLYTTTITRAEIRYGVARLPAGAKRDHLQSRADALFFEIAGQTLSFDSRAADAYGHLVAGREKPGRPVSVPDAQIAAIARVQRAAVATRNVKDFEGAGIVVIDPFAFA